MPVKKSAIIFTGGHHTGALPVASALQDLGYVILWFGHRRSMWGEDFDSAEYREVVGKKIIFFDLQAGKFHQTIHPLKLLRIPWGFFQAIWLIFSLGFKYRIRGIVSFGGYLAFPTVICGLVAGIPSITHEQTSVSGWANRIISLFAKKIALTWPESSKYFPSSKAVVVGLPLRPEVLAIKRRNPPSSINSQPKTVYFTGGKNGSRTINKVVFAALPELTKKFRVIHQTGFRDLETAKDFDLPDYKPFDYDSSKAVQALSVADVVVGRSGAHTVYELAALGIPSVLIPIPWVSHGEQEENAQLLASRGLAIVLPQEKLNASTLIDSIDTAQSLHGKPLDVPKNSREAMIQLIKQEFSL